MLQARRPSSLVTEVSPGADAVAHGVAFRRGLA